MPPGASTTASLIFAFCSRSLRYLTSWGALTMLRRTRVNTAIANSPGRSSHLSCATAACTTGSTLKRIYVNIPKRNRTGPARREFVRPFGSLHQWLTYKQKFAVTDLHVFAG